MAINSRKLFVILFSFFLIMFGSFLFIMYGNCQISKLHWIVQEYYMPEYLPDWMLTNKGRTLKDIISGDQYQKYMPYKEQEVYKNYTGQWKTWHRNGSRQFEGNYINGILNGEARGWNNKNVLEYIQQWNNGILNKQEFWDYTGNLLSITHYDINGKFEKRDFYKNGKIFRTEKNEYPFIFMER